MKKALTIKNPWAYLVAAGIKDIENRSFKTNFRGTILIHSAKVNDKGSVHMANLLSEDQWKALPTINKIEVTVGEFNNSSIIGQVDIVDCIQDSKSIWAIPGQWHWVLKNAVMYAKPVTNVKGQLGIWNYKGELDYYVIDSWSHIAGGKHFSDNADTTIIIEKPNTKKL